MGAVVYERMPLVRVEAITIDCRDERRLNAFWRGGLGYEVAVDPSGDWLVPQACGSALPNPRSDRLSRGRAGSR